MTVEEECERARKLHRQRWMRCWLGMTILPLSVACGCLHFGRTNTDLLTSLTLPLPLLIGLFAVWQCPCSLLAKFFGSLLYVLIALPLLFVLTLSYVCDAYHACL